MFLLISLLIILLILLSLDTFKAATIENYHIEIPEGSSHKKNVLNDLDVFVINLDETLEGRRRYAKLKNLENPIFKKSERFKGYYGKTYNYKQEVNENIIRERWNVGKWKNQSDKLIALDKGEIGVALSHYYLWKNIINKNKITVVLEDDAIKLHEKFDEYFDFLMSKLPKDWDFFLLGYWLHRGDDGAPINEYITKVKNFVLMHGMVVSPRGAQKAVNLKPIDMPIDSWMSKHSNKLNIYRHNLKTGNDHSLLVQQNRIFKQIKNTNNW